MLYTVVTNDWGETTYIPTTLGNVLLVVILIALLAVAVLFAHMQMKKTAAPAASDGDHKMNRGKLTVKQLAFCAMAIALGTVLSNIKLFHFPTGGSITLLSMLVICLPGYWFGLGAGITAGVAYGVLQLLIDPYVLYPMQLVVDYLLAFGALGLSGLFSNAKFGLIKGYIAGVLGRYVFAVTTMAATVAANQYHQRDCRADFPVTSFVCKRIIRNRNDGIGLWTVVQDCNCLAGSASCVL